MKKDKLEEKSLFSKIGICLLIVITFCLTQILLPINIGSRTIYLYYVEVFLIGLFIIAFLDIIIHKKKINIPKKWIIVLGTFCLWFLILTIYRFVFYHDIFGGFIIFRVLFFPTLLACLLKQYNVDKEYILMGIIFFVFLTNLNQLYKLFWEIQNFRLINALQNINIYLCFMISSIPLMFQFIDKYSNTIKNDYLKYLIDFIIYLNVILIFIFSVYSGSRIGVIMCPFIILISFICAHPSNIKSFFKFLTIFVLSFAAIFLIYYNNLFEARSNIFRSVEPVLRHFVKEDTRVEENNDKDKVNNNSNKNSMNNYELIKNEQENLEDSNNMRSLLWEESIKYIKKNPIFGKTSVDIEINMVYVNYPEPVKMIQSPHNFILEMWLALGLPGLLIYGSMLLYLFIKVLLSKLTIKNKINFVLITFVIMGFSFFQPLVTSYFVISILLWLTFYLYMKEV